MPNAPTAPAPLTSTPQAATPTTSTRNPAIVNLTKAIALQEGGGAPDYSSGQPGGTPAGGDGEVGAYQWLPGNFQAAAKKYGFNPDDMSPTNQNQVAYAEIEDYVKQGYQPQQIASLWNSGDPDSWQPGTVQKNGNTPAYVQGVNNYYRKLAAGQPGTPPQPPIPGNPTGVAGTPDPTNTPAPAQQPQSLASKLFGGATAVANAIPGVKTIGDVFGTAIAAGQQDPKRGIVGAMTNPNPQQQDILSTMPTPKQTAGAGLEIGADIGGVAAAPETLAGSAATFAGVGAAQAGGSALENNQDPKSVAQKAFIGGLTGAAIGAAGYGVQKGIQAIAKNAPTALMNNALKIGKQVKMAGKSPANFLVNEGVWGSLGSIRTSAQKGIADESSQIAQKVESTSGGATWGEIKNAAIARLKKSYGNLYSDQDLNDLIDSVPAASLKKSGIQSWKTVNQTRQQLGNFIGDKKWLMSNPTQNTEAAQAVYRSMAKLIQGVTDTGTNFSRLTKWIGASDAVDSALADADKKWGIGLLDMISGGAGAIGGLFGGNPVAGGAAGMAAERALRSPITQTGMAKAVSSIPAVGGAIGRGATTNTIAHFLGMSGQQDNQSPQSQ